MNRSLHSVGAAAFVLWAGVGACAQQSVYELTSKGFEAKSAPEPGSDAAVIADARAKLAEKKYSEAIGILDKWIEAHEITKNPNLAEAYLVRGDCKLADSDEFEAARDYEVVCRDYPASEFFVRALERELEVAKLYLGGLSRKSLWFMRFDSGVPYAEEIILRINERLPGSKLAERSLLMLADYYYTARELRSAAQCYDIFLTLFPHSEARQKAMQRRVYANIAQFKGPRYDASGLIEAQFEIERYRALYPAEAERSGMGDALTARLDESAAQQLLGVAVWYDHRGDPTSQKLTLQKLVKKHPGTSAAQRAIETLDKNKWPRELPARPRFVSDVPGDQKDVKPAKIDAKPGAATPSSKPAPTPAPPQPASPGAPAVAPRNEVPK